MSDTFFSIYLSVYYLSTWEDKMAYLRADRTISRVF